MPFHKIHEYAFYGKLDKLKQELAKELANNRDKTVEYFIELPDEDGSTLLLLATGMGHADVVEYLIAQNANLRAQNSHGLTSLHEAICGLIRSIESGKEPKNFYTIISMLLQKDIGLLGVADHNNFAPFDLVNRKEPLEIKERFLQIIKNVNPIQPHPLLEDEELVRQAHQEIADARLSGINFYDKDFSVAKLIPEQQEALQRLGKCCFRLRDEPPSIYRRKGELYYLFTREERNVIDYSRKWNPHFAAANGYVETMQILLNHGVDPNLTDEEYGTTLLAKAAFSSHAGMVKLLLDKGALALKTNRDGQTPLQFLQRNLDGREEIVALLKAAEVKEGRLMESPAKGTASHKRTSSLETQQAASNGIFSFIGTIFRRHYSAPASYQPVATDDTMPPQESKKSL